MRSLREHLASLSRRTALWYYVAFASVSATFSYLVLLCDTSLIRFFCREDGFFENLGVLAFLVTSVLFVLAFVRTGPAGRSGKLAFVRSTYILLALLFIACAGEEISWGQRILGIDTPEQFSAANTQGEINIHNLSVFQITSGHNLLRWMFILFWFAFTFAVPVAASMSKALRRLLERFVPVIPWPFGAVFVLNYAIWRVVHVLTYSDPHLPYRVNFPDEIMETNIAVLFVLVALYVVREHAPLPTSAHRVRETTARRSEEGREIAPIDLRRDEGTKPLTR